MRCERASRLTNQKSGSTPGIKAGVIVAIAMLLLGVGAEFLGNGDPQKINTKYQFVPPQPLRFFDEGRFRPHQNLLKGDRDPVTSEKVYVESGDKANVGLFVRAWEYRFLGFIPTDRHLLGFSDIEHNYKKSRPCTCWAATTSGVTSGPGSCSPSETRWASALSGSFSVRVQPGC